MHRAAPVMSRDRRCNLKREGKPMKRLFPLGLDVRFRGNGRVCLWGIPYSIGGQRPTEAGEPREIHLRCNCVTMHEG